MRKFKFFKNKIIVQFFCYSFFIGIIVFFIPYFITEVIYSSSTQNINQNITDTSENIDITNDKNTLNENDNENLTNNISIKEENPEMESYIIGVVAAEMPVSFENDALKAQAVAARTYAYRQVGNDKIYPEKIGQAFISTEEMKKRWGDNFDVNYKKVSDAVNQTKNEIMVYAGEPILAAFHSTSCGVTESSQNVWEQKLSYLQSVDSSEDENAPDFLFNSEFLQEDFKNKFLQKGCSFSDDLQNDVLIKKRTDAGYVSQIQIGGKLFKGSEVRIILGLRSTNFQINYKDNKIIFQTKGYGHGAGMSQYGANFMAKKGKKYKEILSHYYYGVEFISIKG